MLKVFDEDYCSPLASDNQSRHCKSHLSINEGLSRNEETGSRKVFLPRGSAQSKFEPRPYYYFASKCGAVPSWAIDEISQGSGRSLHPELRAR